MPVAHAWQAKSAIDANDYQSNWEAKEDKNAPERTIAPSLAGN
jgi:hypothetical protein